MNGEPTADATQDRSPPWRAAARAMLFALVVSLPQFGLMAHWLIEQAAWNDLPVDARIQELQRRLHLRVAASSAAEFDRLVFAPIFGSRILYDFQIPFQARLAAEPRCALVLGQRLPVSARDACSFRRGVAPRVYPG